MKKRQYKMLSSLARELQKSWIHDAHMRGVDIGYPTWRETHPHYRQLFYAQARNYMKAAGLL